MAIEFGQLVAQLHGQEDTRFLAATLLDRSYNLTKHPYVHAKVNEVLNMKERVEQMVGRWDVQTLYAHPQAIYWKD